MYASIFLGAVGRPSAIFEKLAPKGKGAREVKFDLHIYRVQSHLHIGSNCKGGECLNGAKADVRAVVPIVQESTI